MTTVDWVAMCDLAYFDSFDRLCMFGIETTGGVRTLQAGVHRLAFAIHLRDRDPSDEPEVSLYVTSPRGHCRTAEDVLDFCVESRGEYLLVHVPSLPLHEEGVYRFELACGTSQPAMCDVSVLALGHADRRVHCHGAH